MNDACLSQAECAFGEIFRRFRILALPLEFDLAKSMLIFRVCCKLHNFAIRERDPFYDTYGGVGTRVDPPLTEHEAEGPRAREGNAAMKQRRDEWARALKRAGLYRRTRRS